MEQPGSCLELPPQHILEDILNRLEDARAIARAQCVSKEFLNAGNGVRSLRFIVLDEYHERARDIGLRSSQATQHGELLLKFKDQMVQILNNKNSMVQLHVEVESKLQAKTVLEDERRRTDFWISDPRFLKQWLPSLKLTLEHLCIVDYGQQAIMHDSTIIKILSENCKRLKTLDLRNMSIDTSDCEKMASMASLTLQCVKVTGGALQDINEMMPKLQSLALRGVFGVRRGHLTFPELKVLFLGLFTPANDVVMELPRLEELHVKMKCPQKLHITAPVLKYVAFNLEVTEPSSHVQLRCMDGSQELVYGASTFITLSSYAAKSRYEEKFFSDVPLACVDQTLDIPCMALLRDGRYSNILNYTPFSFPSRSHGCHGHPENTPVRLWQLKRQIPEGLNLLMNLRA